MKFYKYLNEDKITQMARPFMNEFGDKYENDAFIWRGHKSVFKNFTAKERRKDRNPRFVRHDLHIFLNKISRKLFGWDLRTEGIFAGHLLTAAVFGTPYIFVPLGKYRYVWADEKTKDRVYRLYDQYSMIHDVIRQEHVDLSDPKEQEGWEKGGLPYPTEIKEELESLYKNNYKIGNLSNYLKGSGDEFEAIFDCDKYLLIEPEFWHNTMKMRLLG